MNQKPTRDPAQVSTYDLLEELQQTLEQIEALREGGPDTERFLQAELRIKNKIEQELKSRGAK